MEFKDKLEVDVFCGEEDGEDFRKLAITEAIEDDDSFEFISLKKGYLEKAVDSRGEPVVVPRVQDSVSLGSPEYIDKLIESLRELRDKRKSN